MYAIKMNTDKSLTTTIRSTIYQYEHNADTLLFLVPMTYDDYAFSDGNMRLFYVLPNGGQKEEPLEMDPEPYKTYYQYRLPVTTMLTSVVGEIELWLECKDEDALVLFKSGSAFIEISPKPEVSSIDKPDIPDSEDVADLKARVSALEAGKADNIIYDEEDHYLQLTADGEPIGDKIDVGLMTDADGDGVIDYDNPDSGSGGSGSGSSKDDVIYF